jgi:hypothetical protein
MVWWAIILPRVASFSASTTPVSSRGTASIGDLKGVKRGMSTVRDTWPGFMSGSIRRENERLFKNIFIITII